MFLTKIEPYLVLLIQIVWYNHLTSVQHLALLAVHIFGAVLLSTGGVFELSLDTLGDLLLFVAVAGNALLYVPTQKYAQALGAMYAAGFSQLFGGLMLVPFTLLLARESFVPTDEHTIGWYYALLTVFVFHVLSTGMWFASMRHVPAWLASALRSFGPVLAAPVAWLWFNQPLSWIQTAGAFLVVVTSAWMVMIEKREK
jgi:drug/metabolite transporter (DMT)-like permease